MVRVILKDTRFNENDYLELTDDQHRLLTWLDDKEFLADIEIEVVDIYEFQKI